MIDEEEEQDEEDDNLIPTQACGGTEDGNAVNTCTHDDNAYSRPIDNTINDDFDNSFYNDGADYREGIARESSVIDSDEISVLSISLPVSQRQSKRQLTDVESQASSKRSRTIDRRKKPPTLKLSSSPEMPMRSLVGSYAQSVDKKPTGKPLNSWVVIIQRYDSDFNLHV